MRRWAFILLIALVTLATFSPIVKHQFLSWDDPETIRDNPRLKPPTIEAVAHYWRHEASGLYVPVTYSFWALLAMFAHHDGVMNPAAFHASSVALHTLSVLVVFSILRMVVKHDLAACVGALLFAVHPVQVEAVAWASGTKDLLGGLCSLLVVQQYVLHVRSTGTASRVHYAAAIAALIIGMLAKPTAVVAPIIAVIIDIAFVRRDARAAIKTGWPMIVLTIPCVIWSRAVQNVWEPTVTAWWTRPFIAADALTFYLYKLVWPLGLTSFYGRTPQVVLGMKSTFAIWIVPAVLVIALMLNRNRKFEWLGCLCIFVAGLLPVLGFTPFMYQLHSTVADHYLYLPMLGVGLAAAMAVSVGLSVWPTRGVAIVSVVLLGLLTLRTLFQLRHWCDDVAWASRGVELFPQSFQAHASLGSALASVNRIDDAIAHFQFCADSSPNSALARRSLAQALIYTNRFEEAIPHAQAALDRAGAGGSPDRAWEHYLLGRALVGAGRIEEGQQHLDIAARLRPSLASPATTQ